MKQSLIIGSGLSAYGSACLLKNRLYQDVIVIDENEPKPDDQKKFDDLKIPVLVKKRDESLPLNLYQHVILSPSVPMNHPWVSQSFQYGTPVLSEVSLGLAHFKGHVLAVTGTNGKSTVCAMIAHILNTLKPSHKPVLPCGNYGDPVSLIVAEGRAPETLALELSSYQLDQSSTIPCQAAAITSFSSDHLERHITLHQYFLAKWRIWKGLTSHAGFITPKIASAAHVFSVPIPKWMKTLNIHPDAPTFLKTHDQLNGTLAAFLAQNALDAPLTDFFEALKSYKPLAHRCEEVGLLKGQPVFNDSKSTNLESTLTALHSMKDPVLLFLGGKGKKQPYEELLQFLPKIHSVVTFGPTGPEFQSLLSPYRTCYAYPTLKEALRELPRFYPNPPCPVLFSPACASFDEFRNYEHRGHFFKETMKSLWESKDFTSDSSF